MAIPTMRGALPRDYPPGGQCHPGLLLTRYLHETDDNHEDAGKLLNTLEKNGSPPDVYEAAFRRWNAVKMEDAVRFRGKTLTPMAIGLGAASPLEVGLTLHHTYGMPYIPGSALKGLLRRAARSLLNDKAHPLTDEQLKVLVGDTNSAAFIACHDAWLVPRPGSPFSRDVVTPHHPDYYQKKETEKPWPTDFDDPVPVPFLVVKPGFEFLFTLQASDPKWAEFAAKAIQYQLENAGVGGKTNAGYGRLGEWSHLEFPPPPPLPIVEEAWESCTVVQKVDRGVTTALITCGGRTINLNQQQWQDARKALSDGEKEQVKKKSGIVKNVVVKRQGDTIEFVGWREPA